MSWVSVWSMVCVFDEDAVFCRYVSDGVDKIGAGDTFVMVSKELDLPLETVKKQLKKNPFIEYISIALIKENLDYLRELGFNDAEISDSIQLILYPKWVENLLLASRVRFGVILNMNYTFFLTEILSTIM